MEGGETVRVDLGSIPKGATRSWIWRRLVEELGEAEALEAWPETARRLKERGRWPVPDEEAHAVARSVETREGGYREAQGRTTHVRVRAARRGLGRDLALIAAGLLGVPVGVRFGLDGIVDFLIYAFMGVGLVWGAARRTLRRLRPDDVTVTPSEVEARRGGRRTRRTARSELLWVEVVQESDSAYAQTRGGKSFWDTFLARDEKSWAVLGRTAAGEPVLLADSLDREVALAAAAALEDTLEL
ncbi:MAG TPA: hypothetical protein RMH26_13780, partial [Polyangiaceae bacterium LLY-WYZ-15_(1-7)]|nr:hypothetical protein [Polyangiaceae bacterium LLY-WYZ-15_(1-7)]